VTARFEPHQKFWLIFGARTPDEAFIITIGVVADIRKESRRLSALAADVLRADVVWTGDAGLLAPVAK
jgi:hypothetical protein